MDTFDYHFYNNLKYSNKIMKNENKSHVERNSINHNLVNYKTNNTSFLTLFNTVLIILYYLILGYFIYAFLMNTKTVLPINKIIIGLLLLYPFIIQPIQQLLYGVYRSTIEYLFNKNITESFVENLESISEENKQYLSEKELNEVTNFNQEYKNYIQTIQNSIKEQTAQEINGTLDNIDEWISANQPKLPIQYSNAEKKRIADRAGVSPKIIDDLLNEFNKDSDPDNQQTLQEQFDSWPSEKQQNFKDLIAPKQIEDLIAIIRTDAATKQNEFVQQYKNTSKTNNQTLNTLNNAATFIKNNKNEMEFTDTSIRYENKEDQDYIMYSNLLLAGLSTTILYFIFTEL